MLPSVAASVIGGTSLFGGRGGYTGTIIGAALTRTVLTTLLPPPANAGGGKADLGRADRARDGGVFADCGGEVGARTRMSASRRIAVISAPSRPPKAEVGYGETVTTLAATFALHSV